MRKGILIGILLSTLFPGAGLSAETATPLTSGNGKQPIQWPPSDAAESRYILRLEGEPLVRRVSGKGAAVSELRANARTNIDRQQSQVADAVRQAGGKVLRRFGLLENAIVLSARASELPAVRRIKGVKSILPDQQVQALLDSSVPAVNAPAVWAQVDASGIPLKGAGVTVGIIDSGIDYTHPDLGGCFGAGCRVVGGYDFVNDDADPMDDHYHGTHVAGIVAANGTVTGVAPEATLYAYKVLSAAGSGYESDIIAAVEASTDPNGDGDTSDHLDVINLSLGGPGDPASPMATAVNNAVGEGVIAVVAAGNSGPGASTIDTPGNAERALTVAAYDHVQESMAGFSSRGPVQAMYAKPDISAPGVAIHSTVPGGLHEPLSGTSMAAPHVAGAAALLLQAYPDLTPSDVAARLMTSARPVSGESFAAQGAGVIDILAAWEQSLVSSAGKLHLGRVDNAASSWSGFASFSVRNTGSTTEHVELGVTADPDHPVTYGYSPSVFDLAPGAEQVVNLDVQTDASTLGFPTDDGHIDFSVNVQSTSNTLRLPAAFMRNIELKTDFALNNGGEWVTLGVIHDSDPIGWLKTTHTSATPAVNLYAPPGVYHAVAAYGDGAVVTKKFVAGETVNQASVLLDSEDATLQIQPAASPSQDGASDWSQASNTWTYWGYTNPSGSLRIEFATTSAWLSPSGNIWRFSPFEDGAHFFYRSVFRNNDILTAPDAHIYMHYKDFDSMTEFTDNSVPPVFPIANFHYSNDEALTSGVEVDIQSTEIDLSRSIGGVSIGREYTEPFLLRFYSALSTDMSFTPHKHTSLLFRSDQGVEYSSVPVRSSLNEGTQFLTVNTAASKSNSNAFMLLDEFPYIEFDINGAQRHWIGKAVLDSFFLVVSNRHFGDDLADKFDIQLIGDAAYIGQDFFSDAVTYRLSVDGSLVVDAPLPSDTASGDIYLGDIPIGSTGLLELDYPIDLGAVTGTGTVIASWPDGGKLRGPYIKKLRIHRQRNIYEDPGPLVSVLKEAGSTVFLDFQPADDDGSVTSATLEYSIEGAAWQPLTTYAHGELLRAEMPYIGTQPYDRSFSVRVSLQDNDGNTLVNTIDPAFVIAGNTPPVADAGGNYSAAKGDSVTLDGSASNDPDSGPGSLSYWWFLPGGESGIQIDAPYSSTPTTTLTVAPDYSGPSTVQLWLIVDDGVDSHTDMVEIHIN
jgi:hypothetical protein